MIAIPALTFADRLASLRATKLRQTAEKRARLGPVDADDTGIVLPPEDFAWQPTPSHPNGSFYGPKAWAENFRSMLEAIPVYMDPADALAGRWRHSLWGRWPVKWHPDYSYAHLVPDQQRYGIIGGIGHPHHFAGDYTVGLQLGWDGILAKIRHWRGHGDAAGAEEFRDALETVVRAIQGWIRRTVALARHLETFETRPGLRENLAEVIAVNEWIVGNPPRTFREACQWIAWFNMASRSWNGDGAGGRLDVLLEPYFERDTAAGLLDEEEAVFILACLLLNDPHYYQLGGPAPDGHDVTSRLSFLVLDAAHRIGIPCNLTVRVHDGLDPRFLDRAVRYLLEDRKAWPRFMGDKGMTEGFVRNGYPPELARQRIAVGCHWAVIPGREYTLNDVVKINVAKVFELALAERLGSTPAAAGSEALWDGFCRHLDRAVHCTVEGIELHLAHQWETAPELVIDLLCHGPIEKGRDASGGGVEFYNMCIDGAGLATVADSFAAIEQRIESEGVLTWGELAVHLRENFAGPEGARVRAMLRASERYGAGGSRGDAWAVRVSQRFSESVRAEGGRVGRVYIPGWFSWANTIGLGRQVGATPNGRLAGEPISTGANPDPGFRRDGAPTAMARAIAAVQPGYGNTAPMQLELDPGFLDNRTAAANLTALIQTHFRLGGTLMNINLIDQATLRAAVTDPARFPDLVVRVTGFTAYMASLSPELRALVAARLVTDTPPGGSGS